MKKTVFAAAVTSLILCACDGPAPQVDPHKPVVDGKAMTQADYLNKYCNNRPTDPNCIAVSKAMREDSTKRNVPKGW
jgi:hypothetical protein